jgi:DeoR/GlpR family transcriptional regulator of sugar metabolism
MTAELLTDGESVVLDSGTTALEVARCLAGHRVTVMPLSLHAASVLAQIEGVRLLMPGGEVRPGELSFVGPLATSSLAALRFDTAVLSCCGLADGQVTAHDLGDAQVKQAMRASASRTVLVADSSKFARSATAVVCATSELDVVVTDSSIPTEKATVLRGFGVELLSV